MAQDLTMGFRKIDIDDYVEDDFKDEDMREISSTNVPSMDEKHILRLSSGGKYLEAIQYIFSFNPHLCKDTAFKETAANLMLQTMLSVKTSDIDSLLAQMDVDQLDLLMKYIYKGFEIPSEGRSAQLLVWHQKVFTKAGLGSIVRVLTDKKRV